MQQLLLRSHFGGAFAKTLVVRCPRIMQENRIIARAPDAKAYECFWGVAQFGPHYPYVTMIQKQEQQLTVGFVN